MKLASAVLLAALLWQHGAAAAPPSRDAAQLAVLVERAGSLHLQGSEGAGVARARRALARTVEETDRALAVATRDAPAAMREHYALFTLWWRQHRAWLSRPASRAPGSGRERDEEATWLADRGRSLAGEPPGAAADAWHAARLSQRAMRLALLPRGAGADASRQSSADAMNELRERLDRLQAATRPDSAAHAEVQVARSQFEFLSRALAEQPLRGRSADVAARSADHVLEALERAIRQLDAPVSASPG